VAVSPTLPGARHKLKAQRNHTTCLPAAEQSCHSGAAIASAKEFQESGMESLTRLVTESLARHGFDRPLDYRRLRWSRWFRCESHHSLLLVPSKPGVFAVAEEIVHFESNAKHIGTAGQSSAAAEEASDDGNTSSKRMLAVTQFFEADDMAFVLDRMLVRANPMRERLVSGRYFIRYVVIEDASHRGSVCASLNQWVANSMETATGIASHFASSLELTPATEYIPATAQASLFEVAAVIKNPDRTGETNQQTSIAQTSIVEATIGQATIAPTTIAETTISEITIAAQHLNSGATTNIHCPSPLPSGF
jgi:hypothetical protein